MVYRRIDIASRAADITNGGIVTAATDPAKMAATASSADALTAKYQNLAIALESFATAAIGASEAFKALSSDEGAAGDGKKKSNVVKLGTFWFLEQYDKAFDKRGEYKIYAKEWLEEQEELSGKQIDIARDTAFALKGYDDMQSASVEARAAVFSSAHKAMGDQMLRLIEIGHFSGGAFAKVVAQQVKVELVGLAAKAAIWAIYETAMGLKDLAVGSPTAGLHFASAAEFGAVAGASLAAAAGVQAVFFGGTGEGATSGRGRGEAFGKRPAGSVPMSFDSEPQTKQGQNIIVNIYNPLSDQNWQKITEDNIVPAINNAASRNINLVVRTA